MNGAESEPIRKWPESLSNRAHYEQMLALLNDVVEHGSPLKLTQARLGVCVICPYFRQERSGKASFCRISGEKRPLAFGVGCYLGRIPIPDDSGEPAHADSSLTGEAARGNLDFPEHALDFEKSNIDDFAHHSGQNIERDYLPAGASGRRPNAWPGTGSRALIFNSKNAPERRRGREDEDVVKRPKEKPPALTELAAGNSTCGGASGLGQAPCTAITSNPQAETL